MWKSWRRQGIKPREEKTDYASYRLSFRETALLLIQSAVITAAFAYMFYRSAAGLIAFPAIAAFRLKKGKKELTEKRMERLGLQFKDTILSVISGIQAGYSIENAFLEAEHEMASLYGRDGEMTRELSWIRKGLKNRIPLEQLLLSLGKRSHVEEIKDFTEVFAIAKRSGGSLKDIIRRTAALTEQRMEVEREIASILAAQKYEQKVMSLIPFFLFGYMELSSRGYFDMLYHNITGISVMTLCLGLYLSSCILADRIMRIKL